MLLLAESVEELMGLGHNLWNECVLIVVLNIKNLAAHLVILLSSLVHITN